MLRSPVSPRQMPLSRGLSGVDNWAPTDIKSENTLDEQFKMFGDEANSSPIASVDSDGAAGDESSLLANSFEIPSQWGGMALSVPDLPSIKPKSSRDIKRKTNRARIACVYCRSAKLKCGVQRPCPRCASMGQACVDQKKIKKNRRPKRKNNYIKFAERLVTNFESFTSLPEKEFLNRITKEEGLVSNVRVDMFGNLVRLIESEDEEEDFSSSSPKKRLSDADNSTKDENVTERAGAFVRFDTRDTAVMERRGEEDATKRTKCSVPVLDRYQTIPKIININGKSSLKRMLMTERVMKFSSFTYDVGK
eukprot:CAMPEP_0114514166 /NCGR_PEP_ID=MMETSP0109-20121206/15997_1 /TAXON_ID=29199 /ORGANISM="Chlorarachnion reptans, Strain CCCM449" /LENGTH=306 /DNA_ID=CAMNT_0001694165 /DNA_START=991 /DNA_END=1912 /DNA_ORIENTATION=+